MENTNKQIERNYYNNSLKEEFRNAMISANKTYISAYDGLFKVAMPFEQLHKKDLYEFSTQDLLTMFKSKAKSMKYTTVVSWNSLVKNYKEWAKNEKHLPISEDICTVEDFKLIPNFKQYIILNDDDIDNITIDLDMDGADYNCVLFLRLFWEIDGQEKTNDILKIKVSDVNADDKTVTINKKKYTVSNWLINGLLEFADITSLTFNNKNGSYKILSAQENSGYIFRMTYTARTKVGEAIDGVKLSNLLYQFCERNLTELLNMNDLLMSLALRYMVQNKKTHAQMYTQKRYFKNIPSSVFAEVFNNYAKINYPKEFNDYMEYYSKIENAMEN